MQEADLDNIEGNNVLAPGSSMDVDDGIVQNTEGQIEEGDLASTARATERESSERGSNATRQLDCRLEALAAAMSFSTVLSLVVEQLMVARNPARSLHFAACIVCVTSSSLIRCDCFWPCFWPLQRDEWFWAVPYMASPLGFLSGEKVRPKKQKLNPNPNP